MTCRFRRLALKYHPDTDSSEEGHTEFKNVCEAYGVLSNGGCTGTGS